MAHESRLTNRHLRGQLAQAISALPVEVLYGSPVVEQRLASGCVAVWVAVEETGRNDQWYEKTVTRQLILNLFEKMRGVPWFNRCLLRMFEEEKYTFTRFVNLLLNEMDSALDQSFKMLSTIARLEAAMEDR